MFSMPMSSMAFCPEDSWLYRIDRAVLPGREWGTASNAAWSDNRAAL
jgi:hypothetical protein